MNTALASPPGAPGRPAFRRRSGPWAACACLAWLAACGSASPQDLPRLRAHVLTDELRLGYQLLAVDLDGDGKTDVIAVDEQATELAWFENAHPVWRRHVLAVDVPRPLNADAWDADGDGTPELVLAYRFDPSPERSAGSVSLFKSGGDVRKPWTAREIDRVPTAHRVRWFDPEGNGKKVLVVAPLVAERYPPREDDPVPIYLYRPGEWKRETLSDAPRGILHAVHPVDWDASGRQQMLTACYRGLQRIEFRAGKWTAAHIARGDPRPCPDCGASEVRVGRLGKVRFLAAIEPWHGNQLVVYAPQGDAWQRTVIDDAMDNGHALDVGDLDGDGRDEIVCGFRGKGRSLSVYQAAAGGRWRKTVLDDGGMAAADCVIGDFTGDGAPDIVCIGASTRNLKLYENLGREGGPARRPGP